MKNKTTFLVIGYLLGAVAALVSLTTYVYSRAKTETVLAAIDCAGDPCKPEVCGKRG